MSTVQKWHDVVMSVQNANMGQQKVQKSIKRMNKIMYKKQLDRQVQQKNHYTYIKNTLKAKQRQQVQRLAQIQKTNKIKTKIFKQQIQKHYANDNLQLLDNQKKIKTASQQIQRKNIKQYLQHPFIKLVDEQENRKKQMKKNFIKQNQINQIQQQIKNKTKNQNRFKQKQQKDNFINYVQQNHQRRSQQRQRFKNKYLRLKKGQIQSNISLNLHQSNGTPSKSMSVQQMYVSYLNNQIANDRYKKLKQKYQYIDDKRISKIYQNNLEPDSSPAYLGRNPLNYEKRRQLYYINKHLNTNHHTNQVNKSVINSSDIGETLPMDNRQKRYLNSYLNKKIQNNPQDINKRGRDSYNQNYKSQNKTQTTQINPYYPTPTPTRHYRNLSNQPITMRNPINQPKIFNQPNIFSTPVQQYRNKLNNSVNDIDKFNQFEQKNRRIKSQLNQNKSILPNIKRSNGGMNINSYSTQLALPKKQYKRYDFITGKDLTYYL